MISDYILKFLSSHQPMPKDELISETLAIEYDNVRLEAMKNPHEEYIELFLRSYGCGDGLGVYPLLEDFYSIFDKQTMIRYLKKVLEDKELNKCSRYWVSQIAMLYPSHDLIKGMNISVNSDDGDTKEVAEFFFELLESK